MPINERHRYQKAFFRKRKKKLKKDWYNNQAAFAKTS